ncbi:hypothetical protein OESDEN_01318 [Oesophagostomum dentatum]|uniref:Uncharacterized protein n=1 Tax=Oesophagostomum dentatum TaxID=61180 RepID=A0A0B1TME4_OESDE|nr:hypothetical protein OESDEN_01318 [Oesophagostomum dentatum]
MHLISTKFGYVLSGAQRESDPSDVPQKTEKELVNEAVQKKFNGTIVKKPGGYYVRLPWKENHDPLPDNKSLALARLCGIYNRYKADQAVLKEYDMVFKDQLAKGILEQVPDEEKATSTVTHYLPHKPVFTPLKATTKMRIAFVSAHLTGKPCLNDEIYKICQTLKGEGITGYFEYISTNSNPADCATRGLSTEELREYHPWWTGPTFTIDELTKWPQETQLWMAQSEPEVKSVNTIHNENLSHSWPLERFSTMTKAVRTMAYLRRFLAKMITNFDIGTKLRLRDGILRLGDDNDQLCVTGREMHDSRLALLRLHQREMAKALKACNTRNLNVKESDVTAY